MKQIIYYVLIAILLFAIYGAFNLSVVDFKNKDVCPKVLGIPACYIVFVCFFLAAVAHILTSNYVAYFVLVSLPFILALGGTLTELAGTVICPRTPGGTPMCFISLGICSTLLVLKFLETRLS